MKLKIGIFDSGIGGFTILNSLLKTRKDVEVFYLADTKRIPFGSKNFKEGYKWIGNFLLQRVERKITREKNSKTNFNSFPWES